MPKVKLRNDKERFDQLLRRFKKSVDNDGLIQEIREREAFEKQTTKRKRAKAAAVKRWKKKLALMKPIPRSTQR